VLTRIEKSRKPKKRGGKTKEGSEKRAGEDRKTKKKVWYLRRE
jgi:hypothetical protein